VPIEKSEYAYWKIKEYPLKYQEMPREKNKAPFFAVNDNLFILYHNQVDNPLSSPYYMALCLHVVVGSFRLPTTCGHM